VCGTRQGNNVEISYPSNAEHQYLGADGKGLPPGDNGKFLRICADCGETIVRIGRGEIGEAVRNNPALIPALVKGISPKTNPDDN
jgi:hypothetical protein